MQDDGELEIKECHEEMMILRGCEGRFTTAQYITLFGLPGVFGLATTFGANNIGLAFWGQCAPKC